jgi:hypothetical protein
VVPWCAPRNGAPFPSPFQPPYPALLYHIYIGHIPNGSTGRLWRNGARPLSHPAQPRNHWPPATCYTAESFIRCAERKWLLVVGQCRPLKHQAQPRNRWPPATCYTADGSRWCAERKWLVVVRRCKLLNHQAHPKNRWPPATCYTSDGSQWCAERKWLVVVRQCRPLNHQAQPRNLWPPATCYTDDGSRWCAERKRLVVVRQYRPLNLDALILVSCELSLATLVFCELSLAPASLRLCAVAAHPAHGPCCGSDPRHIARAQPSTNASRSAFNASKNRSNRSYFTYAENRNSPYPSGTTDRSRLNCMP